MAAGNAVEAISTKSADDLKAFIGEQDMKFRSIVDTDKRLSSPLAGTDIL